MKKIVFLIALTPFLLAMQCDPDPGPCGQLIEFEKPDLISIENAQTNYVVGDVLWLSSTVDRNQINPTTNATYDLFATDTKLSYYIDFRKNSLYIGYNSLYLNEDTAIVEHGELNWDNIILVKTNEQFKSKIGIKLLEPGTYSIFLYNIASYNPQRNDCNFKSFSMITDFNGMDSNLFTFVVE